MCEVKTNKNLWIGILGILITIGAFVWLLRKIDFELIGRYLGSIHIAYPFIAGLLYFLTFFARGLRWKLILGSPEGVSFMTYVKSIFVGFTGNNLLPARAGELIRSEHFVFQSKTPRINTMTSLVAEKILDAITMLSILIIATSLSEFTPEYSSKVTVFIKGASIFTATLVFILAVVRLFGHRLGKLVARKNKKIGGIITDAHDTLSFLKLDLNFLVIMILGAISWILEGLMFVLFIYALAPESHYWLAGLTCIGVVNFGIVIPSSPGYLGVFQAATVLALSFYGINSAVAFVAGFAVNICMILSTTPFGLLFGFKDSLSLINGSGMKKEQDKVSSVSGA